VPTERLKNGLDIQRATHTKKEEGNCIGHVVRRNCLLKYVIDGKIQEWTEATETLRKDVNSYWLTLRRQEVTGNWKRMHLIALCGELDLE